MFLNLKSGLWELYNTQTSLNINNSIFAKYFEVDSRNNTTSNVVKSTNQNVTVRVMSDDGSMEKIIKTGAPGPKIFIEGTKNYATLGKYGSCFIKGTIGDILIVSFGGYETYKATIGSSKKVTVILKSKKKKEIRYNNTDGKIGINISKDSQGNVGNSKIRLGADITINDDYDSIGLTIGYKKSNTLVSDEYSLSDFDFGVVYGKNILKKYLKLKGGLGFEFYNYDVTESFGPFYDIGEGVYYSAGLQLNVKGFTLDAYYNNYGLGYGIGIVF